MHWFITTVGTTVPITTPGTTPDAAAASTGGDMRRVLWFAVFALGGFIAVALVTAFTAHVSASRFRTMVRGYALLAVAAFGASLAATDLGEATRTAAFTLLGTVAGYLAGAAGTSETPVHPPSGGAGTSDPSGSQRGPGLVYEVQNSAL